MTGIIVTGHGHFASGIMSSVELIMGTQENVIPVDFPYGDTITELEANINSAIEKFDGDIIVFADLLCGSPFNVATMAALKDERIRVVYGTNLGMLVESIMNLSQGMHTDELVDKAVITGKTQVGKFEKSSDEEDDFDN